MRIIIIIWILSWIASVVGYLIWRRWDKKQYEATADPDHELHWLWEMLKNEDQV